MSRHDVPAGTLAPALALVGDNILIETQVARLGIHVKDVADRCVCPCSCRRRPCWLTSTQRSSLIIVILVDASPLTLWRTCLPTPAWDPRYRNCCSRRADWYIFHRPLTHCSCYFVSHNISLIEDLEQFIYWLFLGWMDRSPSPHRACGCLVQTSSNSSRCCLAITHLFTYP